MNGRYGDGLLAFQHSREMAWRALELGAWVFIATAALWFLWRAFRA